MFTSWKKIISSFSMQSLLTHWRWMLYQQNENIFQKQIAISTQLLSDLLRHEENKFVLLSHMRNSETKMVKLLLINNHIETAYNYKNLHVHICRSNSAQNYVVSQRLSTPYHFTTNDLSLYRCYPSWIRDNTLVNWTTLISHRHSLTCDCYLMGWNIPLYRELSQINPTGKLGIKNDSRTSVIRYVSVCRIRLPMNVFHSRFIDVRLYFFEQNMDNSKGCISVKE